MPKKEPIIRYKATPGGTVGTRATVVSSPTDHGSLQGLGDDDHSQYAALAQDETITGAWTISANVTVDAAITIDGVDLSDHSARHDPDGTDELTTAAPGADSVNVAASGAGAAGSLSRSDHTHNLDEAIVPTWTGAHLFQATMTTRDLLPEATDTYDIGSSTYWYSQQFVSQINAAVFAEEQIMLLGGWLYISHDAGSFAAEVGAAATTIDFGKTMTPNDFVIIKAYDKSATIKTEYIQVLTLVSGTTYNVTRDLAAAHGTDPNWAQGVPFAVLGQTGDGRIELNAYDAPRIQIIVQDDAITYNNTTEYLRLGDMNGAFGSDAADEWGLGVGDYSGGNYMTYNTTDGFAVVAGDGAVHIKDTGMVFVDAADATSRIYWKETSVTGDTLGYITADWAGGGGDDVVTWITAWVVSGLAADDAEVILLASDVDAGTDVRLGVASDETGYFGPGTFFINTSAQVGTNANMDIGLTIQQGAYDTEATAWKSSDVAHGMTDDAETDTYGTISKANITAGGLYIRGYSEASGYGGVNIAGARGDDNTTKSVAGLGNIGLIGHLQSAATVGAPGADANLVVIRSASNTRFIFDQEGEMHSDAIIGVGNDWDDWDDLALASDLSRLPKAKWDEMMRYGAEDFERAGLLTLSTDEDGTRHAFLKTKAMLQFSMCCFREVYDRMQRYERALIDLGASPEALGP